MGKSLTTLGDALRRFDEPNRSDSLEIRQYLGVQVDSLCIDPQQMNMLEEDVAGIRHSLNEELHPERDLAVAWKRLAIAKECRNCVSRCNHRTEQYDGEAKPLEVAS